MYVYYTHIVFMHVTLHKLKDTPKISLHSDLFSYDCLISVLSEHQIVADIFRTIKLYIEGDKTWTLSSTINLVILIF